VGAGDKGPGNLSFCQHGADRCSSGQRFRQRHDVGRDAEMLVDSTLVHSRPACRYIEIPATREARETLGRDIVANIIMLGALVAATGVVSRDSIEKAILDSVPKGTESLNLKAMKRGFELAEGEKSR